MFGFRIIRQYEQGIVFRIGQAMPGVRKPGLTWINPFTSRLTKVSMQMTVANVPAQETITRDNVTLKVDAVVYYRVVDPLKAFINVRNYHFAASQAAQTSLRAAQAASVMAADPAALQLRLLQAVVEVAAEKNSTLVMPFPVELLRFFDRTSLPRRPRHGARQG